MRPTVAHPARNQLQEPAALQVRLETGKVEQALRKLATELARTKPNKATIDLTDIQSLHVAGLDALATAVQAARAAGTELCCVGVRPPVYKALHLAKLGTLITRVPARP